MTNEIWIYDVIGEGFFSEGVTAKRIRDDLAKVPKDERVVVRINSPGGDVFEATAIRALLSEHKGGVDVKVDGVAASAASYIAMIGETVEIAEGAMMMIHRAWTVAIGNEDDMMAAAKLLQQATEGSVTSYIQKTGRTRDEIMAAMIAESWYTADEAVEFGLADSKIEVQAKAFAIPTQFGYKNAPQGKLGGSAAPTGGERSVASIAAMRRRIDLAKARAGV